MDCWFAAADSAGEFWDEEVLNELGCCDKLEVLDSLSDDQWLMPELKSASQPREVQKWQWTAEEDQLLIRLARQCNRDWSKIVEFFPNKSVANVKKRYLNKHSPHIRKFNWTPQEDKIILALYAEQGCSWIQIAEHLPGRQPDAIKNRFYGTLRKKLSETEQAKLARRPKPELRSMVKIESQETPSPLALSLFNEEDLRQMTSYEKLQRIDELCNKVDSLESFLGQAKQQISRLKATLKSEST